MKNLMTQFSARTTDFMRFIGVLVVVAGMCSFLLEEWQQWNDIGRYFVMFGGSCLFAAAGLFMSYLLRDNTGARVFLGLSLASVVANFTTLGGFIHSLIPWDGLGRVDLSAGTVSGAELSIALACSYLVLVPVSWFAFRVLSGHSARLITFAFAGMNTLLLVPFRESFAVGVLIGMALVVPVYLWRTVFRQDPGMKTTEGRMAMLGLFGPAIIMLGRAFWLYHADAVLVWMLSTITLVGLQYAVTRADEISLSLKRLGLIAVMTVVVIQAVAAMFLLLPVLESVLTGLTLDVMVLPLFGLILSATLAWVGQAYPQKDAVLTMAGVIFCGLALINLVQFDHTIAVLWAVAAGGICWLAGRRQDLTFVLVTGWLTVALAVLPQLLSVAAKVDFTHWGALTVLGVGAIFAATLFERRVRR